MNAKDWKKLIGTTIWLVPQQNAIIRHKTAGNKIQQRISATLTKVGSKMLYVDHYKVKKFYMDGSLDDNNYGWKPFATEQELLNYYEARKLTAELKNASWEHLNLDTVRTIANLVIKN